jgi:phospholipase/carboxylesterase
LVLLRHECQRLGLTPTRNRFFLIHLSRITVQSVFMLETELIRAAEPNSQRLMIVLHGLGDSAAGFRWLPSIMKLPWLNYLLVNAPDPYYGGYAWYDFGVEATQGIERSSKLIFKLLDAQRAKGFPTETTLLFGFSQGCLMTIDVGLRYPQLFAGLIGISGYIHEPDKLMESLSPLARQQRLLITHGTEDSLIPFAQVREQIDFLKSQGIYIQWHELVKGHTIAGEEEVDIIRDFIQRCYHAK